jgi:hypothetical protein
LPGLVVITDFARVIVDGRAGAARPPISPATGLCVKVRTL